MKVTEILEKVRQTAGSNDKKSVLEEHKKNDILKRALKYGLDPLMPFNIVKVPKVKSPKRWMGMSEEGRWGAFFDAADDCANRSVTGNTAVSIMHAALECATPEEEKWMRKILKKHLAIGASTKTVNKVFSGLVPTFEVSLAQKFEEKRLTGKEEVAVEPKLDGIRCFAIVEKGAALLYARSGKLISNFDDTIGAELSLLPDGCYDGEIMGEDFVALMRQAYRKDNVVTEGTYLSLFDYLPMTEWISREAVMTCRERYVTLCTNLQSAGVLKYVCHVQRYITPANYADIKQWHDEFVEKGYEGAMIKDLSAPYKFGRGPEVMKLKAFHDADLYVIGFKEGTGRHVNSLGSILVEYEGVEVNVGSGFDDDQRAEVWGNRDNYMGMTAEIQYQEVTPDGSLRFPTFVCWRLDK